MTVSRLGGGIVAIAMLIGTTTSCTPTDVASADCLDNTPIVVKSGVFDDPTQSSDLFWEYSPPFVAGTTVDGRAAAWSGPALYTTGGVATNYRPLRFSGETAGVCMVGGSVQMAADPLVMDQAAWHKPTALTNRHPQFTSVGLTIDNVGDGINMAESAVDFRIIGARMTNVHDDCVEDDGMRGGLIEDSYLECWSGLSARGYDNYVHHRPEETVTVRNSLIYATGSPQLTAGHVGWFKFSNNPATEGTPPKLVLDKVVLRVDTPPNLEHSLELPPTYRDVSDPTGHTRIPWPMECIDVVIVWGGAATYGPYTWPVPPCATVTEDLSVWQTAVANWEEGR